MRRKVLTSIAAASAIFMTAASPPLSAQAPPQPKASKPSKPYHQQIRESLPKNPAERARALSNLYALLATAQDAQTAKEIAQTIEGLWFLSYSDTVSVLMERSINALTEKNGTMALEFLDAVVELAPDYAEGWHRRAVAYYVNNDYTRALGDLRRALALEPNNYKALDGLATILRELGRDKQALEAYRRLVAVHPYFEGAKDAMNELKRKVEGQGI